MKENIELLKQVLSKSDKLYFMLFIFISIYIIIKWSSFFVESTDLNVLRNEKKNIKNIASTLQSIKNDYIEISNINFSDKESISQLKFYLEYLINSNLVANKNKEDVESSISFLRYIVSNSKINLNSPANKQSNITIQELLRFSRNIEYYRYFTNNIDLMREIRRNVDSYNNFTNRQKSKIIGGEDIFVGIIDNFGIKLQTVNSLDINFENQISILAKKLFYSVEEFKNLSIAQLNQLVNNYDEYINELLRNKMTKRNTIPIINLTIDRYFFSYIILLSIVILSFLLNIEAIRLKRINPNTNLCYYNHSFIVYLFFPKQNKKTFSKFDNIFLSIWSLLNLLIPIIILIISWIFNFKYDFEVLLIILFTALFYSWLYLIYNYNIELL